MEADVEGQIGAGRYERSDAGTIWRNGFHDRVLDTRLSSLKLCLPKLRPGSYFSSFLEARKTSEKALIGVIHEAWIGGVSTRRLFGTTWQCCRAPYVAYPIMPTFVAKLARTAVLVAKDAVQSERFQKGKQHVGWANAAGSDFPDVVLSNARSITARSACSIATLLN